MQKAARVLGNLQTFFWSDFSLLLISAGLQQASEGRQEECSFLKKRTKRLLLLRLRIVAGRGLPNRSCNEIKVFWFFSSEKNILTCLLCNAAKHP
jgi:hypothetical protein